MSTPTGRLSHDPERARVLLAEKGFEDVVEVNLGSQSGRYTNVEHEPAPFSVVESWVGIPAFVTGDHHEGGARDDLANRAFIEQFAAGLRSHPDPGDPRPPLQTCPRASLE